MKLQSFLSRATSGPESRSRAEVQRGLSPRGERDIDLGTNRVLDILRHTVSRNLAHKIYTRSRAVAARQPGFDLLRLRRHLASYCLGQFSAAQVEELHSFLTTGGRMR